MAVQRRLAAILAADVEGYSRLMGEDEEGTLARFNAQLDEIVGPAINQHRGRLVKTMGDGFLVEFGSVVDAVQCAADIQSGVGVHQDHEPDGNKMLLRVGIHLGDVIVEDQDIHGDGVNIAARLEGLAEPGAICVSDMVHAGVRHKLALDYEDMGEQSLKNIADPVRVFRIAGEVASDMPGAAVPADALFRRPAVAVLPFQNMSGDSEQEYFSDGLTEEIITALSIWRTFPVIARNSTFAYKGTTPDIRKVGQELGARYVIEGSVRKTGDRVRVTAQLINSETGHHVWAERYDRRLEDIFELQEEIARRVAGTVEPELHKAEHSRSLSKTPASLDAWECFHRGMSLLEAMTKSGNKDARTMFERAIVLDPDYSRAHAALAFTHHRDFYIGFAEDRDNSKEECLKVAQQAVALDDNDAFAHAVLGFAYVWNRKLDLAIMQGKKALELNPSSAFSCGFLSFALLYNGNHTESIAMRDKCFELNPRDPFNYIRTTWTADAYLNLGQYDKAVEYARMSIGRSSDYLHPHVILASSYGYLGRLEEAEAQLAECERVRSGFTETWLDFSSYRRMEDFERIMEGLRKAGLPE